MSYIFFNANPMNNLVIDCTVRAISNAMHISWDEAYIGLTMQGFVMKDMPSSNRVWGAYLKMHGFKRNVIPNTCPDCYSVSQFCSDHPIGTYLLGTGSHVVSVINGDYYDTWDSGDEVPIYYWERSEH